MTSKQVVSALTSLALLATLACSKTEDTAPERRIFGNPPSIQTVDPNYSFPQAPVDCDFTDIIQAFFCNFGILDVQPQTGRGWTVKDVGGQRVIVYSDVPTTVPGVFIEGMYTEIVFAAKVVDQDSTPQQSNVLLVSASFRLPAPSTTEISLVLFDDGSTIDFPFEQKSLIPEDCTVDLANQACACVGATYKIKSGDTTKGDNSFTRKFAIADPQTSNFLLDCIMRSKKEIPYPIDSGTQLDFKIEAVDRQGNLSTWPNKISTVVGNGSFVCNGDSCGCCLLHANSQLADISECHGLDGMISPSQAPNGVCKDLI